MYSAPDDSDFTPIENEFKRPVWGGVIGAGLDYRIHNLGFFAEGQYHPDFTKFIDIPVAQNNVGLTVTNTAALVNLGIRYFLTSAK